MEYCKNNCTSFAKVAWFLYDSTVSNFYSYMLILIKVYLCAKLNLRSQFSRRIYVDFIGKVSKVYSTLYKSNFYDSKN